MRPAVIPGMRVSVSERMTLIAEQASRVAAAAHLLRYFPDERAGIAAPDVGEIHWLLFWPEAPAGNRCRPDAQLAAEALMASSIRQLEAWGVTRQEAAGELPVPGVYGVPEQRPHISALYERAGFSHAGDIEIIYSAKVEDLRRPAQAPIAGLSLRRTVGMNGTRISAMLGDDAIGYIEVEIFDTGERLSRNGGLADVGNLYVTELYRRRGVGTWLLRHAADWLSAASVDGLLD